MYHYIMSFIYWMSGWSEESEESVSETGSPSLFQQLVLLVGETLTRLPQKEEGVLTAKSAFNMAMRVYPGVVTEDWTLVMMGGSSSIQGVMVRMCKNGSLEHKVIPELMIGEGIKGKNVRDFVRDRVLPLQDRYGWHFMILTSGFYLGIAKSKDQWAVNMRDLEAFIHAKADGSSIGTLMTNPTLVFQNDDESYAFDVMGLLMREVSFDEMVVKPTFTDDTHGDVGGASVYAINSEGISLNVNFPKGDVAAAASAIRQVASETGVTQFYCTGVWRD
jgi:hypothetical protein